MSDSVMSDLLQISKHIVLKLKFLWLSICISLLLVHDLKAQNNKCNFLNL